MNGNDYILLVYVDDIIITGPRTEEIIMIKEEIQDKFEIEDFGEISYLLGMRVSRTNLNEGFLLDQEAMITRLLQDHQITCKRRTPCSRDIRHLKQHNDNSESTDLEVNRLGLTEPFEVKVVHPSANYRRVYLLYGMTCVNLHLMT